MAELSSREAVRTFADAVNRVAYTRERVVVTRRGRRIAALVSLADLEKLETLRRPEHRRGRR